MNIDISGVCADRFARVKDAFATNFVENGDVGASLAVVMGGELVIDLWGGFQDTERTIPWQRDTLINVFSTTKTMSCLSLLVLASRGMVDLDAPVEQYWPEFGQNGKGNVLIRHLLSHTAGIPAWDQRIEGTDLYDWHKVTSLLAEQATWWEPGWKSGYHGITQGNLVGEVVRRVDGRTVGRFFAEEIAAPTGADFHIGLAAEHDSRVALVIPVPPLQFGSGDGSVSPEPDSIPYRASNPRLRAEQSWELPWRRAEIPAAGGHGTARGVALAQAAVSHGGSLREVELLSPKSIDRIFDVQAAGRDLVLGIGVTFGVGYGLNSPRNPISPNVKVCYWGGWGGSLVVNDIDAGFTMAYVMNRMGEGAVGDDRAHTLLRAIYASLDKA
ncbi:MAG: class A beta-lactamase-related serine hydrolase [Gammaproteobacteria bacterium]|nr:class A beta-lactamase-related serine hydrolase [Gammaproteobacteria bacterium]